VTDNILELTEIVGSDRQPQTLTENPQEAQIWAFLGACGGAGVSSLCVSAACILAGRGQSVLLVDLDFERGDLAAYLDQPVALSLEDLNQTEGRMDADLAASHIKPVDENLSLLACAPELGGNDQISAAALLSFLDVVSTRYDFMILDVPALWRVWTEAVLAAADYTSLVTEARVPALRQTDFLARQIQSRLGLAQAPGLVLNKYERRNVRSGLTLADTHKALGRETDAQIVIDDDTLRAAINTGIPAPRLKPGARYVKSVTAFIDQRLAQQKHMLKKVG